MKIPALEDAAAREEAAHGTANVAVTAGAGTGKTTLLVDAVLSRVLVRGADLRSVLLLTFTEKAAGEMAERLRARLAGLKSPGDDKAREARADWLRRVGADETLDERLDAAISALDRAEILTIHSFCAHVLREFPIEAGLDPAFEVDARARFDEKFAAAWERFLDVELGAKPPRGPAWRKLLRVASLDTLRKIAEGLASFSVPEEALDAEAALKAGRRHLESVAVPLADALERRAALWKPEKKAQNNLVDQMRSVAAFLRKPRAWAEHPFGKEPSDAKTGWGDEFAESKALAKEALKLAANVAEGDEATLRTALELLGGFARAFRDSFTREGWVGFDGLLLGVRRLLLDPDFPQVRAWLKSKYAHVLVDEFQDTDPVQGEIVQLVAESVEGRPAREASSVRLGPGKLFIVGDPKQSIYSFRGADIVAYSRFKTRLLGQGGRELFLRTNFRSHSGLTGAVNGLFAGILREEGELQPAYEPITPVRDPRHAGLGVRAVFHEGAKGADAARIAEGAWIADWISSNVGVLQLEKEKLGYGHVALLFKALTDVHLVLEGLRERRIPYVVEGEKHYYGTSEVIDAANLLRVLANPRDRVAMAGLLRSPLGAIDDRALLAGADRLDFRGPAPEGAEPFYALLRELHGESRRLPVPELIDRIFERTAMLELAALSRSGEQAVANLLKLRRAAEDFEASGVAAATLRQFLRRVERDVKELTEEGESALADEKTDAVRVMSIHKAKGLEWPVVILPDLHRGPSRGREDRAVTYDWPDGVLGVSTKELSGWGGAALAHRERRRREAEVRRLLYVALTRAKDLLILSGSADFENGSPWKILAEGLPAGWPDRPGTIEAGSLRIEVERPEWKERPERKPAKSRPPSGDARRWKSLHAAWERRESEARELAGTRRWTSPSRLQESAGRAVPAWTDEEERLRRGAAATGTLVHRVLELLDFKEPDWEAAFEAAGAEEGADVAEAKRILGAFAKSSAFKDIAKGEIVARELPVLRKAGASLLQGSVDAVVRMKGKTWVLDWKTDRDEDPSKYVDQERHYVAAVEGALGIKVAGFRLVYLRSGRMVGTD